MSTQRPLILALWTEQDSQFGHLFGQIMSRNADGQLINWMDQFSEDRRSPKLPRLEDFIITSQWSDRNLTPYAWECVYRSPYSVTLADTDRMRTTLRTLATGTKKVLANPKATLEEFVLAVVKTLQPEEIVWAESRTRCTTGYEVVSQPLEGLAAEITRRVSLRQSSWT